MKTTILKSPAVCVEVAKLTAGNSEAAEVCEGVIYLLIQLFPTIHPEKKSVTYKTRVSFQVFLFKKVGEYKSRQRFHRIQG